MKTLALVLGCLHASKLKFKEKIDFSTFPEVSSCDNCASVVETVDGLTVKTGLLDKTAIAYGTYDDTLNTTGWGVLNIHAHSVNNEFPTTVFWAAGLLEGFFTAERIKQNARNMEAYWNFSPEKLPVLQKFFEEQAAWARNTSEYNMKDPYWLNVANVMQQFEGLYAGVQLVDPSITRWDVTMLNGIGDLIDLERALFPQSRPDLNDMTDEQLTLLEQKSGHCSALVRVTPGFEDLFMGHSSWFTYSATNRIFKHYTFDTNEPSIAATSMSFSSYAGYLESLDDFYVLSSGLVMLQTTINCLNATLYDLVTPQSLLSWQRVRVANHMATSGQEWADYSMRYNSGTYNNQYMVINNNLFKPNEPLADNLLWVIEQMPGHVGAGDETDYLRMGGFWPSYNVPFFPEIYNVSGNAAAAAKFGPEKSYELAPRAKIFRRDAGNVNKFEEFKDILRYNDYLNDEFANGDPWKAICSRGDLASNPSPSGCYDTKATTYKDALSMESWALSGPTLSHDLPKFSWKNFEKNPHEGLPDAFADIFVHMKPSL